MMIFNKIKLGKMFKTKKKSEFLSENFKESEFKCKGTGTLPKEGIDPALVALLEKIRKHFDAPVLITSGYRSPSHNEAVGGAKGSYHVKGMAADIRVGGTPPSKVYNYINTFHKGGLGRYKTFTHIDVRNEKARWQG